MTESYNILPIVLMISIALLILGAGIVTVIVLLASRKPKDDDDQGRSSAGAVIIIVVICVIGGLVLLAGVGAFLLAGVSGNIAPMPVQQGAVQAIPPRAEAPAIEQTITAPVPPSAATDPPAAEEPTDE